MKFGLEADTTPFIEWLNSVRSNFPRMVETMKNVARIIELESIPYVPLDTGALEQSYEYQILDSKPNVLSIMQMSLSIVFGTPITQMLSLRFSISCASSCAARSVPSPPMQKSMLMSIRISVSSMTIVS